LSCDPPVELPAARLRQLLRGRVCLVGIGNRARGDDGAGPSLIDRLEGRVAARCLDAGVVPENHAERIAALRPDVVLLLDAVNFGATPGAVSLAPAAAADGGISSHNLPLRLLGEYLQAHGPAAVLLLGIQPESTACDRPLTGRVARTVDRLAELLTSLLPGEPSAWTGRTPVHTGCRTSTGPTPGSSSARWEP